MTRAPVTLPTGDAKRTAVTEMFDRVAPSYDRLNRVISLGQDRRWRRRALDRLALPPGSRVLDVACGTGDLCRDLRSGGHVPVGVDLSPVMLEHAGRLAPLVLGDAAALPVATASCDGVTCGFALRNFADLDATLAEMARVLRTGGRVVLLDAGTPSGALARAGHRIWFHHAVPFLGGLLGDGDAYRYLPASTAYLPPAPVLLARVAAAGFAGVERTTMMAGAVQLLTGTRS